MSQRVCGLRGVMVMSVAFVVLVAVPALAQDSAPRTAWGEPDLQGVWDFRTITPMQRPERYGDKEFLTAEEAAALDQAAVDFGLKPLSEPSPVGTSIEGAPDKRRGRITNFGLTRGREASIPGRLP